MFAAIGAGICRWEVFTESVPVHRCWIIYHVITHAQYISRTKKWLFQHKNQDNLYVACRQVSRDFLFCVGYAEIDRT